MPRTVSPGCPEALEGVPTPRCFAQRVRNLLKINYLVETAVQKSAEEYQNKGDEYETLMEHTVNGKLSPTQKLSDYRNGLIVASHGSDCLGRSGVNGALKVLHYGVCCIIAKWKYLHHDYRAGFPGRVNPEKRVVDTGPRQGPA